MILDRKRTSFRKTHESLAHKYWGLKRFRNSYMLMDFQNRNKSNHNHIWIVLKNAFYLDTFVLRIHPVYKAMTTVKSLI